MYKNILRELALYGKNPTTLQESALINLIFAGLDSIAEHPIEYVIKDRPVITGIHNLAIAYIRKALKSIDISWDGLLLGTEISEGLDSIEKNPALLTFTQAILVIVFSFLIERAALGLKEEQTEDVP